MKNYKYTLAIILFITFVISFGGCEKEEDSQLFDSNQINNMKTSTTGTLNPFEIGKFHNLCLETLVQRDDFYEVYKKRDILHKITCDILKDDIPLDSTYNFRFNNNIEDYAKHMKYEKKITEEEYNFLIFLDRIVQDSSIIEEKKQGVSYYINSLRNVNDDEKFNIIAVGSIFISSIDYWNKNSLNPEDSKWINQKHFPFIYSLYELRNSKLPYGFTYRLSQIVSYDCIAFLDCRITHDNPDTPWDNGQVREICIDAAWISSANYAQTLK